MKRCVFLALLLTAALLLVPGFVLVGCDDLAATGVTGTSLPLTTTSMTAIPTQQSSPTTAPTEVLPHDIQEQTRYEGILDYECDSDGCWRVGGTLTDPPEYYFPDIEADNPDIQALLADIGLYGERAVDDEVAWRLIWELWAWLARNTEDPGEVPEEGAMAYLHSLSYHFKPAQYPSIDDLAKVCARYHVIPWSGCTARALTFATLLYRCGIDPNRMAAAYFKAPDMSIQHFYVVIRSGDHWYWVDPTCNDPDITPELPYEPENIGWNPEVDYEHPFTLAVIPGSTLTRAMLVK
jgi:hypothetical protein